MHAKNQSLLYEHIRNKGELNAVPQIKFNNNFIQFATALATWKHTNVTTHRAPLSLSFSLLFLVIINS